MLVHSGLSQTPLAAHDAFNIDFFCDDIPDRQCTLARETVGVVSEAIAHTLRIYRQLNVTIKVLPFIPEEGEQLATLAVAYPANYYAAKKGNGQLLMVPKALLKQSRRTTIEVIQGIDFEIHFNSNINWIFGNDIDGVPLGQFSFTNIAVQQFIRGLGFITSLQDYGQFLAPDIVETSSGYSYFSPPSAYDVLIAEDVGGGFLPIRSKLSEISTFPKQRVPKAEFLQLFEQNDQVMTAARQLYTLASNVDLYLKTNNNRPLGLHTRPIFFKDNLSYLTPLNMNALEYSMVQRPNRFSFQQAREMIPNESIIGPLLDLFLKKWATQQCI